MAKIIGRKDEITGLLEVHWEISKLIKMPY
jgi:hypothetical protein